MQFELNKPVLASWLANQLNGNFEGNEKATFLYVAPITSSCSNSLSFIKQDKAVEAALLICPKQYSTKKNTNYLRSDNPRFDFIRALEILDKEVGFKENKTPPVIHSETKIGQNVSIGNNVSIGEGTVIEHNCVIMSGTEIGKQCLIRAGAIIGSDGFGFERDEVGFPVKFIHLGGVKIGDNVEIGANTCVAKGTLDNTVIEDNVKIDNLVHIAHNCILRDGAFITACAEVSGGVVIGKNSWIAPNISIIQKINIGEYAFIGTGAVINKDVPAFALMVGVPAKQIGWMSAYGEKLDLPISGNAEAVCPHTNTKYKLSGNKLEQVV